MRRLGSLLARSVLVALVIACQGDSPAVAPDGLPARHGTDGSLKLAGRLPNAASFAQTGLVPISLADPGGPTATQLAQLLGGAGVVVSNVSYVGVSRAAGTFSGGEVIIGFEQGIVLSTGAISSVAGPNETHSISANNGAPGDNQLTTLAGQRTFDAAILQFDFVPGADKVFIQFVFSSDEYNEYVGTAFNDAFAFFVNGVNCARAADGRGVAVNTINLMSNAAQYRNNELPGATINTEMDGLTTVLTCEASVMPGQTNTMRLAIADADDSSYDSNVFIKAGSLTTTPPNVPPVAVVGGDIVRECTGALTSVVLNGTGSFDEDGMIIGYRWLRNDVVIATGPMPTVALGPGTHTIVLEVMDNREATGTATFTVTVRDTETPVVTLNATPGVLVPADHTYRLIAAAATAMDVCGGPLTMSGTVVSSEIDNAPARGGTTTGDIRVTRPDNSVILSSALTPVVSFNPMTDRLELRAERRTASADRLYTITFAVSDPRGNTRIVTAGVRVPRGEG